MAFDGTRESCPNYTESTGEMNMDYDEMSSTDVLLDSLKYTKDFNRECFNICEWATEDTTDRPGPTYIEGGVCKPCPGPEDDSVNNQIHNWTADYPPPNGSVQDLMNKGIYSMCYNSPEGSSEIGGIPIWFSEQQAANLEQIFVGGLDWVDASTNRNSPIRQLWKQATRGMSNEEIKRRSQYCSKECN